MLLLVAGYILIFLGPPISVGVSSSVHKAQKPTHVIHEWKINLSNDSIFGLLSVVSISLWSDCLRTALCEGPEKNFGTILVYQHDQASNEGLFGNLSGTNWACSRIRRVLLRSQRSISLRVYSAMHNALNRNLCETIW